MISPPLPQSMTQGGELTTEALTPVDYSTGALTAVRRRRPKSGGSIVGEDGPTLNRRG